MTLTPKPQIVFSDNSGDTNDLSVIGDVTVGEIEEGLERRGDTEPMPVDQEVTDDPESFAGDDEDDDWLDWDDEEGL